MRLFLIRHGETVDNVASIYAGVRDSALTVHGVLQAERLGKNFASQSHHFTHIFASNLQRAYRTAGAISATQPSYEGDCSQEKVQVVQVEALREQDFGLYEGKPFYARPQGSDKSGKEEHRSTHKDDPDFQDVESKESMAARADRFLDDHLMPIMITEEGEADKITVAVVSHGIILSTLWRCFLKRFSKHSVTLSPGLTVGTGGVTPLEYLGGWSNTGYLELDVQKKPSKSPNKLALEAATVIPVADAVDGETGAMTAYKMVIKTVNGKAHLAGLKRTRGVGSSQFDEGQKKIESFFKKPRV